MESDVLEDPLGTTNRLVPSCGLEESELLDCFDDLKLNKLLIPLDFPDFCPEEEDEVDEDMLTI